MKTIAYPWAVAKANPVGERPAVHWLRRISGFLVLAFFIVLINVVVRYAFNLSSLVYATMSLPGAVLAEASLSFLGVSVNPPTPSWGSMVSDGGAYLNSAPWLASAPALTIMITVIAVNLLGDGLRDALDPALRGSIS